MKIGFVHTSLDSTQRLHIATMVGNNSERIFNVGRALVELTEPRHEKTNILHMRKQRGRSASR